MLKGWRRARSLIWLSNAQCCDSSKPPRNAKSQFSTRRMVQTSGVGNAEEGVGEYLQILDVIFTSKRSINSVMRGKKRTLHILGQNC
jgi:hypothetical protein